MDEKVKINLAKYGGDRLIYFYCEDRPTRLTMKPVSLFGKYGDQPIESTIKLQVYFTKY